MAIDVPAPDITKQQEFTAFCRKVRLAQSLHKDLPDEIEALQAALVEQAFAAKP